MAGWRADERTDATTPPAPLRVDELTRAVVDEVAVIARTLPYRSSMPVDSRRVFWIDVAGRERVGIAWTSDAPDGSWWLVAFGRVDGRPISRSRLRQLADWLAGPSATIEPAPAGAAGPGLTLVRIRAH